MERSDDELQRTFSEIERDLKTARARMHRMLGDHRETAMAWHSTHAWENPLPMEETFLRCNHHLCRQARERMARTAPE